MVYGLGGQFTTVGAGSAEARELCDEVLSPAADSIAAEPFLLSGAESVDRENIIIYGNEQALCLRFYAARVEAEGCENAYTRYSLVTTDQRCWRPGDYWPEQDRATDEELQSVFGQQLIDELHETEKAVQDEGLEDDEQLPELRYVQTLSKYEIDECNLVPCKITQIVFFDSEMKIVATREFTNSSDLTVNHEYDDGLDELESDFNDVFSETDVEEMYSVLGRLGLLNT